MKLKRIAILLLVLIAFCGFAEGADNIPSKIERRFNLEVFRRDFPPHQ